MRFLDPVITSLFRLWQPLWSALYLPRGFQHIRSVAGPLCFLVLVLEFTHIRSSTRCWVGELPISIYEHQVAGQGTVLEVRRGLSAFETICYVLVAWLIPS
jgi:hypothetical protein